MRNIEANNEADKRAALTGSINIQVLALPAVGCSHHSHSFQPVEYINDNIVPLILSTSSRKKTIVIDLLPQSSPFILQEVDSG